MAISIDTVYQRVLALANKEQRGYITPQEFNLYANQAQAEIFEQYFYDLNQANRMLGSDTIFADVNDILEQKLQFFEKVDGAAEISGYLGGGQANVKILPKNIYRVHRVELDEINCEILSTKDFNNSRASGPLVMPTNNRPVANIRNNILRVRGDNALFMLATGLFYFQHPAEVKWGYFVVSGKALYDSNPTATQDFELHPSEQAELVYKILKFAGLSMRSDDIARAGQGLESLQLQQEKQ